VNPAPVLVYDGDCAFCTRSAELARRLGTSAEIIAWQQADLTALGTTAERARREVLWVMPQRQVLGGAQAIAGLLWDLGGLWRIPAALLRLPPFRWLGAAVYRLVAANRYRLPGGTAACRIAPDGSRPGEGPSRGPER